MRQRAENTAKLLPGKKRVTGKICRLYSITRIRCESGVRQINVRKLSERCPGSNCWQTRFALGYTADPSPGLRLRPQCWPRASPETRPGTHSCAAPATQIPGTRE